MNGFLDAEIIGKFRDFISDDSFLLKNSSVMKNFNQICAIMDRTDSSIEYLNKNSKVPANEHEVLVWFMYASILTEGTEFAAKLTDEILGNLKMKKLNTKYSTKVDYVKSKKRKH